MVMRIGPSISGYRHVIAVFHLAAKRLLKLRKLRFDVPFDLPALDDVFTIAAQEVVDGFDPNTDGARWLVLIEVLEREIGCAGLFDDPLDDPIDRSVVSALKAGDFKRDQVGMPRGE